ncbi:unnamed protein product [Phytomonas sp. Hart1]|nr:unnamed protein product [Phytomonas sp. Hart1]|eukprot:CCW68200.1 unnamed protein product [Phytomonas sp. isolate Hart1]
MNKAFLCFLMDAFTDGTAYTSIFLSKRDASLKLVRDHIPTYTRSLFWRNHEVIDPCTFFAYHFTNLVGEPSMAILAQRFTPHFHPQFPRTTPDFDLVMAEITSLSFLKTETLLEL